MRTLCKRIFSQKLQFASTTKWNAIKLSEVLGIPEKVKPRHIDKDKLITVKLHLKGVSKNLNSDTLSLGATNYFVRKKGQFIYGKQNLFNGAFGIIPSELDGYLSSGDVPALDIIDSKINPFFLLSFLGQPDFYKRLEDVAAGSGSKRIHENTLLNVEISIPDLKEQKRITDLLLTIDEKILLENEVANKYQHQKEYFLKNLFM